MDVIVCYGANHSQFAARYKNQGQTIITEMCDYRNLYDKVWFDGTGFKNKNASEYISIDIDDAELFFMQEYYATEVTFCIRLFLQ